MPERSGDSNQPVSYDMKMLSMQQEQLISSLWRALPQQTLNDPMDSQLQNSHLYEGEVITFPITSNHFSVVGSRHCHFCRIKIVAVSLSQMVVSCECIFSRITNTYWLQLSSSNLLVYLPLFICCTLHRETSQLL